jgi:hypothetical protein
MAIAKTLSQVIPPIEAPLVDAGGKISRLWFLYLYQIGMVTLGTSSSTTEVLQVQGQLDVDADVDATDVLTALRGIYNLLLEEPAQADPVAKPWAPDELLADPAPRAQPASIVTIGASPFTFQAPFDGMLAISGGAVSFISLSRDGVNFYPVSATVPVSRLDSVQVTYSAAPTMVFFPR